jgi:hypothetical protein
MLMGKWTRVIGRTLETVESRRSVELGEQLGKQDTWVGGPGRPLYKYWVVAHEVRRQDHDLRKDQYHIPPPPPPPLSPPPAEDMHVFFMIRAVDIYLQIASPTAASFYKWLPITRFNHNLSRHRRLWEAGWPSQEEVEFSLSALIAR